VAFDLHTQYTLASRSFVKGQSEEYIMKEPPGPSCLATASEVDDTPSLCALHSFFTSISVCVC
jgi:hypothetical protein